jgi:hypothetical protein
MHLMQSIAILIQATPHIPQPTAALLYLGLATMGPAMKVMSGMKEVKKAAMKKAAMKAMKGKGGTHRRQAKV